jgi:hypothetical protein
MCSVAVLPTPQRHSRKSLIRAVCKQRCLTWRAQSCILGHGVRKRRDAKDGNIYEAPERASWVDVRSAKLFRDEIVVFGLKT